MRTLLICARLLRRLIGSGGAAHPVNQIGDGDLRVTPRRSSRGAIVLLHGLSPYGNRDPRLLALADAWAAAGFEAWLPRILSLERLELSTRCVEDVGASLHRVSLRHGAPFMVFAPSFAGTLVVSALQQRELRSHVRALWILGAYADIDLTLEHLFAGWHADEYGYLVVLYNLLGQHAHKGLRTALAAAIRDNLLGGGEMYERVLACLSPGERFLLQRLRGSVDARLTWLNAVSDRGSRRFQALTLPERIALPDGPVFVWHGLKDAVIPAEQGRALWMRLRDAGAEGHWFESPLLNHAELHGLAAGGELLRLIGRMRQVVAAAVAADSLSAASASARGADGVAGSVRPRFRKSARSVTDRPEVCA